MTEKFQALSTQIATPSQTVYPLNHTVSVQDVPQKVEPTGEEEPYTIKCICNFPDDDGNTIYCETCDTWQHIECFYPNNVAEALRQDFVHSCHQCKPRPLDHAQAVERQRSRLQGAVVEQEATNQKPKRPPSKNHKKKPKPTDLQLNGHGSGTETSKHSISLDHPPPAKKAKNSHKPTQSISSQAAKRSPSYGTSRANHHGHPPSPATTPPDLPSDVEIHNYSPGFLTLCKEDDVSLTHLNSFSSLVVTNKMSIWLRDPEQMLADTGRKFKDVFRSLPPNIDTLKRSLSLHSKKLPLTPDTIVRWQYLTTPTAVEKDVPLMELNGEIGFQGIYCADPENRWGDLCCPLPFVFFHPMLPVYIDTRKEGSQARYVRRSCRPNAVLRTFLSGGSEYHFWLVSDRHISANEQITIPWDFSLKPTEEGARWHHLLGLHDDDDGTHEEQDISVEEYNKIACWVHVVLSEHGGCACDLGGNCAFARFHRNYYGKIQARPSHSKKRSRKPKTHTISPTSTGHATNSRAASEGHLDDGPDNDNRSTSGSSRSKPPSRDMTPARQGSFDTLGILTEPTDRDKRKVAMVEDSFRRLEQQPPRKKKRVSDGTGNSSSTKSKGRNPATSLANGGTERHYVDAGTSRSKSGSPASAVSPSTIANPFKQSASRPSSTPLVSRHASTTPPANYCHVGVQTDPVEGEWYSDPGQTPKPRRRIVSLSKRLLDNRHRLRLDEQEKRKQRASTLAQETSSTAMDVDSPTSEQKVPSGLSPTSQDADKPSILAASGETPIPDVPSSSPTNIKPSTIVTGSTSGLSSPVKTRSPDLRVQMPPVPAFNAQVSGILTVTTPLSASSIVQSPFASTLPSPFGPHSVNGISTNPSPVKKKLSLSDYTKSRKAAASRPSVGTTLKPSISNADEPKSATSGDGVGASDSPTTENPGDTLVNPMASTNGTV